MKKILSLLFTSIGAIGIFIFSHAFVIAQQINSVSDMPIDAATKQAIIETLLKNLNDAYVFPEVAEKMETDIRGRIRKSEYEKITSAKQFAEKLTEDLQSSSKDKHLHVRYSQKPIPVRKNTQEPTVEEQAELNNFMKRINFGFEKVERMPGNIGYVDLRGFSDAKSGAETVAAAMNFLANTDALIFDLRQNGGGEPEMVALISSYLFGDKPVHLNSLYQRKGNRIEDFFTTPNLANKKFPEKDVYVLTSSRTFSAAEEFSYDLKNLKRATLIGETTGGGANAGGMVRLSEHFEVFIPTERAISPITKTNWEGIGVEPDIKVPKEQALQTAYLIALNKSMEKTKDADLKNALKRTIEKAQKELDRLKASGEK